MWQSQNWPPGCWLLVKPYSHAPFGVSNQNWIDGSNMYVGSQEAFISPLGFKMMFNPAFFLRITLQLNVLVWLRPFSSEGLQLGFQGIWGSPNTGSMKEWKEYVFCETVCVCLIFLLVLCVFAKWSILDISPCSASSLDEITANFAVKLLERRRPNFQKTMLTRTAQIPAAPQDFEESHMVKKTWIAFWLFKIAMENCPCADSSIKQPCHGFLIWLCWTKHLVIEIMAKKRINKTSQ